MQITKIKNKIQKIIFSNNLGFKVTLMNYGASIISIESPDNKGNSELVTLTPFDDNFFLKLGNCYGKTIGPIAGRIENGILSINNQIYNLPINYKNKHTLHSGIDGLHNKFFTYRIIKNKNSCKIVFSYFKKDLESGLPGNVKFIITYTLFNKLNDILIAFKATTDQDTYINLTNHTYFNLSGNYKGNVLNHFLKIKASKYLTLNNDLIPEHISLVNKVMDFTKFKLIKEDIDNNELQNHSCKGYDHPYIFDECNFNIANIILYDPSSLRTLEVYTTYPSVVIYSDNYPSNNILKNNIIDTKHTGICLETQFVPNGQKIFDNEYTLLKKDEIYFEKTLFKFKAGEKL